jgi:hypothetical protein
VEGIRFQGLAFILAGGLVQNVRTSVVNDNGSAHHDKRPNGSLNFHVDEEQALDSLIDDPPGGGKQEQSLEESRDVFCLAVTEGMLLITGLSEIRTAK